MVGGLSTWAPTSPCGRSHTVHGWASTPTWQAVGSRGKAWVKPQGAWGGGGGGGTARPRWQEGGGPVRQHDEEAVMPQGDQGRCEHADRHRASGGTAVLVGCAG